LRRGRTAIAGEGSAGILIRGAMKNLDFLKWLMMKMGHVNQAINTSM